MLGRWFSRQDDLPDSPETLVLTYGYWRRRFGSDRSIVGRGILVGGKMREIIGVMPDGFRSPDQGEPSMILPFKFDSGDRENRH